MKKIYTGKRVKEKVMYADPKNIKKHQIKLSVDDEVFALVEAITNASGGQVSVVSRDIFMRGLAQSVNKIKSDNTATQ